MALAIAGRSALVTPRHQAQVGAELTPIDKSPKITDLAQEHQRRQQSDALQLDQLADRSGIARRIEPGSPPPRSSRSDFLLHELPLPQQTGQRGPRSGSQRPDRASPSAARPHAFFVQAHFRCSGRVSRWRFSRHWICTLIATPFSAASSRLAPTPGRHASQRREPTRSAADCRPAHGHGATAKSHPHPSRRSSVAGAAWNGQSSSAPARGTRCRPPSARRASQSPGPTPHKRRSPGPSRRPGTFTQLPRSTACRPSRRVTHRNLLGCLTTPGNLQQHRLVVQIACHHDKLRHGQCSCAKVSGKCSLHT